MSGEELRAALVELRAALVELRGRIAAAVKPMPDSSHGEDYVNHGLQIALRQIDYALDAPCEVRPTAYGGWCELHSSPVDDDRPLVDGRCGGYRYVADRALAAPSTPEPSAIDAAHLERQRAWSTATFGPGPRTGGVLDHIRKELVEIEEDPAGFEWIDVVILALDGAWRAGHEPQTIIDAIVAKQTKNEARTWPDWRTGSPDKAIEHVRAAPSTEPALDVEDERLADAIDAVLPDLTLPEIRASGSPRKARIARFRAALAAPSTPEPSEVYVKDEGYWAGYRAAQAERAAPSTEPALDRLAAILDGFDPTERLKDAVLARLAESRP